MDHKQEMAELKARIQAEMPEAIVTDGALDTLIVHAEGQLLRITSDLQWATTYKTFFAPLDNRQHEATRSVWGE